MTEPHPHQAPPQHVPASSPHPWVPGGPGVVPQGSVQPPQRPPSGRPGPFNPPPGWRAPQPGTIPLCPLAIGQVETGALATLRRNALVLFGASALAQLLHLPFGIAAAITHTYDVGPGRWPTVRGITPLEIAEAVVATLACLVVVVLTIRVTAEAALGRRPTLREAWGAVRGRLPRTIGVAAALLLAVVSTAAMVGFSMTLVWNTTATWMFVGLGFSLVLVVTCLLCLLHLAPALPAVVLEDIGVPEALARGWDLTRGAISKMVVGLLVAGATCGLVTMVISMAMPLFASHWVPGRSLRAEQHAQAVEATAYVVLTSLGATVAVPFLAAFLTLLYLDARMVRERFEQVMFASSRDGSDPWNRHLDARGPR